MERDGGSEQKVRAKKVELVTSIMNLRSLSEFEMTLVYLPLPCTDGRPHFGNMELLAVFLYN